MKQRQWRRLMSIAVVASLLLGLAALGFGIEDLRKINDINKRYVSTLPTVSIAAPTSGVTVSGTTALDAVAVGPKVTAVDFLLTGGSYHDAKIATGKLLLVGFTAAWQTTNVPNGTYEITSVGYNALGESSQSASVVVKVKNP